MQMVKFNNKGFSLTEVMIGMMILTVAIVTATNLLTGLQNSNRNNLTTLQAYYYGVEGLEAVRNIRDSNWLHNRDWLGANSTDLWGGEMKGEYAVTLTGAYDQGPDPSSIEVRQLWAPWTISANVEEPIPSVNSASIDNTEFTRKISVRPYEKGGEAVEGAVVVDVTVTWSLGAKERELVLSEILTNWKDGVL